MLKSITVGALALLAACTPETTTRSAFGTAIPQVPLQILSNPAGASVAYAFSLADGTDVRTGQCKTPCNVAVPNQRRVSLTVSKPGYRVIRAPALRWAGIKVRLEPNPAVFDLEPVAK